MTAQIFEYIDQNSIDHFSNYNIPFSEQAPITFNDILVHTHYFDRRCLIAVAMKDNKILDVSSKFLSIFVSGIGGDYYPIDVGPEMSGIESNIRSESRPSDVVYEPLLWALECFPTMPSLNMDDLLNILFLYKRYDLKIRWAVPNLNNAAFICFLIFLHQYYNIEFFFVDPDKTYLFNNLTFFQPYHCCMPETLTFIHSKIVPDVLRLKNTLKEESPSRLALLKLESGKSMNSPARAHAISSERRQLMEAELGLMIIEDIPEDIKICLINNAEYLLLSWGGSFFINYALWTINREHKKVVVLCHSGYKVEYQCFGIEESGYYIAERLSKYPIKFIVGVDSIDELDLDQLEYNEEEAKSAHITTVGW